MEKPIAEQIDDIIKKHAGWKGELISQLRTVIAHAAPTIVEEVKWKMPSRPEGLPVWSHNGIVCIAEIFKNDVKLTFFKGAQLKDTHHLFNARLKGPKDRAIAFHEGDKVNEVGLQELVQEAVRLNQ